VNRTDMKILFHQVLSNDDFNFGYNAATGQYEDLMAAGIIDPTKVCGLVVSLFLLELI
jgi:chaperonin GroEL (HSP60 family)